MSRRKEKAWDSFVNGVGMWVGGGEEYYRDYVAIARDAGLDWRDYCDYNAGFTVEAEQSVTPGELDTARLLTDARAALGLLSPAATTTSVITYIVIRCQRCDHQLDRLSLVRSHLYYVDVNEPAPPSVTSVRLPKAALASSGPITYRCGCGRRDIQVSRARVGKIFHDADVEDQARRGQKVIELYSKTWFIRTRHEIHA